mmetsp:Transcript_18814/g.27822  ORF Transcript_18814/g.27822 Transcript_18814/m.27822 type:complete len:100 (+) Transcript_18814:660-959(+)
MIFSSIGRLITMKSIPISLRISLRVNDPDPRISGFGKHSIKLDCTDDDNDDDARDNKEEGGNEDTLKVKSKYIEQLREKKEIAISTATVPTLRRQSYYQ